MAPSGRREKDGRVAGFPQRIIATALYDANYPVVIRWLRAESELLTQRISITVETTHEEIVNNDRIGFFAHVVCHKGAAGNQRNAKRFEKAVAYVIYRNRI